MFVKYFSYLEKNLVYKILYLTNLSNNLIAVLGTGTGTGPGTLPDLAQAEGTTNPDPS
jgi:hypothetical protein